MQFVVIGKDKQGGERLKARPAHLGYVADKQHLIIYAGPLIVEGRMVGSVFIFDVADRAALDDYLSGDPYFRDAVFETVEVYESRWMVPEREAGSLAAEAERARQAAS